MKSTNLRKFLSVGVIALSVTAGAVTLPALNAKAAAPDADTTTTVDTDTDDNDGAWDWLGLLGLAGLAGLAGKKKHDNDTSVYREPTVTTSRDPNRTNY
ncbi:MULTISPECIES: WGxxGxxG family protein [unclassified Leptolyngbya]|uniref:WGxxGxxG family protein n=1 Tax=unclassified Leptolyngbya TaxID=2650499 RepID=UPI001684EA0C|nr:MULTISPECIES: WGxxGxxG family protein [unclassified Leptolyngbya]MBD1913628.1 WGxxGxxG-CTERM domain-containing protein [Leptolyngbya sp. FACHB-8]MBD2154041.1 WGxxGxxG-CTERM domain-containing protein [Leptolyngbya sp. FACHB-16]